MMVSEVQEEDPPEAVTSQLPIMLYCMYSDCTYSSHALPFLNHNTSHLSTSHSIYIPLIVCLMGGVSISISRETGRTLKQENPDSY